MKNKVLIRSFVGLVLIISTAATALEVTQEEKERAGAHIPRIHKGECAHSDKGSFRGAMELQAGSGSLVYRSGYGAHRRV